MREHGSLPRAREDGLLEERVGEELLLYDQHSHTAHCLSPIAACIWRHCDGEHDTTKLAELAGVSQSLVADALHELREKDLLDVEPELMQSTIPGISRREAIGRVARYGAAAAAGSMIVSATAATPAMASSGEVACNFGVSANPVTLKGKGTITITIKKEGGPAGESPKGLNIALGNGVTEEPLEVAKCLSKKYNVGDTETFVLKYDGVGAKDTTKVEVFDQNNCKSEVTVTTQP
jgi:hypothetical protein